MINKDCYYYYYYYFLKASPHH